MQSLQPAGCSWRASHRHSGVGACSFMQFSSLQTNQHTKMIGYRYTIFCYVASLTMKKELNVLMIRRR